MQPWIDMPIAELPDNPSVDNVVLAFVKGCIHECNPMDFLSNGQMRLSPDRVSSSCEACGKTFTMAAAEHRYRKKVNGGDYCNLRCARGAS